MDPDTLQSAASKVQACTELQPMIEDALYVIKNKWTLPLLQALLRGPARFNELQRLVPGISARALSHELKHLELNGFIQRTAQPTVPASVEYRLTAYSSSLQEVLAALSTWGSRHRAKLRTEAA